MKFGFTVYFTRIPPAAAAAAAAAAVTGSHESITTSMTTTIQFNHFRIIFRQYQFIDINAFSVCVWTWIWIIHVGILHRNSVFITVH